QPAPSAWPTGRAGRSRTRCRSSGRSWRSGSAADGGVRRRSWWPHTEPRLRRLGRADAMRTALSLFLTFALLGAASGLTGCSKKRAADDQPLPPPVVQKGDEPAKQADQGPPVEKRQVGVLAAGDRTSIGNDLQQIGIFY